MNPPRLRMFAGPNGSGKSTIKAKVAKINPGRVQIRVKEGGHDVPVDKIVSRYHRSLNNQLGAVRATNRAFVFDNSGAEAILVAEITDGKQIEIRNSNVPVWFRKHVLDKGT